MGFVYTDLVTVPFSDFGPRVGHYLLFRRDCSGSQTRTILLILFSLLGFVYFLRDQGSDKQRLLSNSGGKFVLSAHHIRVTTIVRAGSPKVGTLSSPHRPAKCFPLVLESEPGGGRRWGEVASGPRLDSFSFAHLSVCFLFFSLCVDDLHL